MSGSERLFAWPALLAAALVLFLSPPAAVRGDEAIGFPEAVARALSNNPLVAASGHDWTAAKKDAETARGHLLPSLIFEEKFVRTSVPAEVFAFRLNEERLLSTDFADVDNFNKARPTTDFVGTLTLEQPLFAPRAILGYDMAKKEAEAKGLDAERAKEETVHRVLLGYLDIVTAREYVRVAERGLLDAREHLRIAEAMEKAGSGLLSDVLRAKVSVASAESRKVTAENGLLLARKALALAMGEKAGTSVDAGPDLPSLPEAGSLDDRIASVRANRTDLKALSLRVANAGSNVTYQRSDYLPTAGAMAAYELDGQDSPFAPDNRSWKIGVGLKWTLFDGLRREAAVGKAAAESGKAKEQRRGADDYAVFQVTRAYLSVREATLRAAIARESEAAAEEGVRLIRTRYENHLARMLDLQDAQTALDAARADRVKAENDLHRSRADLEHASGTLLSWAAPGMRMPK